MIYTVLFDLDGTLSDSARGIVGSLRKAFADLDLPPLADGTAHALVGPPFAETLPPLVGADVTPAVIDRYRVHYATGRFDTAAYDGIADLLAELCRRDVTLAVATSKPEETAVPIVEHLGLAGYFATVGGDTFAQTRGDKALVVGEVLHRLGDPDPATVLMVGDRRHDVDGAAAHGVACVGAGWGYGLPGELETAGAVEVFAAAAKMREALPRLLAGEPDAAA